MKIITTKANRFGQQIRTSSGLVRFSDQGIAEVEDEKGQELIDKDPTIEEYDGKEEGAKADVEEVKQTTTAPVDKELKDPLDEDDDETGTQAGTGEVDESDDDKGEGGKDDKAGKESEEGSKGSEEKNDKDDDDGGNKPYKREDLELCTVKDLTPIAKELGAKPGNLSKMNKDKIIDYILAKV